jgi:hypothetical protein
MDDDIVDDDDFMKRYNEVSSSQNSSIHALGMANIVNDSDQYDHNLSNQVDLAHSQTALKLSESLSSLQKDLSRQPMSLTGEDPSVLTKLEDSLAYNGRPSPKI